MQIAMHAPVITNGTWEGRSLSFRFRPRSESGEWTKTRERRLSFTCDIGPLLIFTAVLIIIVFSCMNSIVCALACSVQYIQIHQIESVHVLDYRVTRRIQAVFKAFCARQRSVATTQRVLTTYRGAVLRQRMTDSDWSPSKTRPQSSSCNCLLLRLGHARSLISGRRAGCISVGDGLRRYTVSG